jgi:alkanesulfonate monooxygenase SsuD/methylene tetrahydromethanopterin reductase-like flavin-dependent oxidoreductase (luciferase family)
VLAARDGGGFDIRKAAALDNGNQPARAGRDPITFVGGPSTVVKGLKEFHDRCGVGVVDLGFQHSGTNHAEVMKGIELFGKEVLPEINQF